MSRPGMGAGNSPLEFLLFRTEPPRQLLTVGWGFWFFFLLDGVLCQSGPFHASVSIALLSYAVLLVFWSLLWRLPLALCVFYSELR